MPETAGKDESPRRFRVRLEWDADDEAWVSYVPALGNLSTFADTRDEVIAQTREAILGYVEAAAKEGLPVPTGDSKAEWFEVVVP